MATWKEVKNDVRTFQLEDEPELIHIIKTGFKNEYMVVHEDAFELSYGEVEFKNREEIKEHYKIELNE